VTRPSLVREAQQAAYIMKARTAVSLFLYSSITITVSFLHNNNIPQRLQRLRHSMTDTTSTTSIPNWRNLTLDNATPLQQRGEWSTQQYEAALQLYHQLDACTDDDYLQPHLSQALEAIEQTYRLYGPDAVWCSFNGGKDAVVLLHLYRAVHAKYYSKKNQDDTTSTTIIRRPRLLYFANIDEFAAVENYCRQSVAEYDLDLYSLCVGFGPGLEFLVQQQQQHSNGPLAFLLGTRQADPNAGKQGVYAPSSNYMAPFLRVNPLLSWSYGHVWHFLRSFSLPYCRLYDEGYTSLGSVSTTLPCPALRKEDGTYWPAYLLRDYSQERAGRISKTKPDPDHSSSSEQTTFSSAVRGGGATTTTTMPQHDSSESFIDTSTQKTVALLVIGDEILKGLTPDANVRAAAQALREHGVELQQVSICRDDLDEICSELQRLRQSADVVITSGGVGPTHDDVTLRAVALALNVPLEIHPGMEELLLEHLPDAPAPVRAKMARLPAGSKLRPLDEKDWPVLQCRNIFCLPGVPAYFCTKMQSVAEYLSCQLQKSVVYRVLLKSNETDIVHDLDAVVERHPGVAIGSYPQTNGPCPTVLTLEGKIALGSRSNSSVFTKDMLLQTSEGRDARVHAALDDLLQTLQDCVLRVDNDDSLLF